ncbi:ketosamine-3-kinase-like [Arapaima gigas]
MEALLKKELGTSRLKPSGHAGGGCISEGKSYETDDGMVFVKMNHKNQARQMFEGEEASLKAILETGTVKVPKPMKVISLQNGGAVFVMEHLDMRSLHRYSGQLGEQLAELHLHNQRQREREKEEEQTIGKAARQSVDKFGFHTTTCCGYLPQMNDWQSDWVAFYSQQRLQYQISMVMKTYGDREVHELWSRLQLKIPQLFTGIKVFPALLHGDLWGGNVAECAEGPVTFDPSSFYGHSEFEMSIAGMFGGFRSSFYTAYYGKIPKAPGFEERHQLYQLFHYLNHWNHFGGEYKGSSLRLMRNLVEHLSA